MHPEKRFMEAAIREALLSRSLGDYSVGAVVVRGEEIIATAGNRTHIDQDVTHHAEILAITEASKVIRLKRLSDCWLYVTHEPCPMCASAAVFARFEGIVSGARIEDMRDFALNYGNERWKWRTINIPAREVILNGDHQPILVEEFMREHCKNLFHS